VVLLPLRLRGAGPCTACRPRSSPANGPSNRVAEKLALRNEGRRPALPRDQRGVWEDHIRYAITAEDWQERREDLLRDWVSQVLTTAGEWRKKVSTSPS